MDQGVCFEFSPMQFHELVYGVQHKVGLAGCAANAREHLFGESIHNDADISVLLCIAATVMRIARNVCNIREQNGSWAVCFELTIEDVRRNSALL